MILYNRRTYFALIINILIACVATGQNKTSIEFLEKLQNENIEGIYGLSSQDFKEAVPKEQFLIGVKMLKQSLGELKAYHFICMATKGSLKADFFQTVFSNKTLVFKIVLNENNHLSGFFVVPMASCKTQYSPPRYDDKTLYNEKELSLQLEYEIKLEFSLVIPKEKPEIICVFLTGSGPQDRDETIGSNKIFKDLAIGLAVYGIGSARYDKPMPENVGTMDKFTLENEYINPTLSIVDYIEEHFPTSKIYLIGHSLGGMIAPIIAGKNDNILGAVLMAANFRPLEQLLIEQMNYLSSLTPDNAAFEEKIKEVQKRIAYLEDSLYSPKTDKSKLPLNQSPAYWKSLKENEVLKNKKTIEKDPLLVLWGEKDYQIPKKDFELWKKTFGKKGGNEFISYPTLNHLFLKSPNKKSKPEEYFKPGHIPKKVILDIVDWLEKNKS